MRGFAILVLLSAAPGLFAGCTLRLDALPEARAALESGDGVVVRESRNFTAFLPESDPSNVGFLFYPGALVEPAAYAPWVRKLAERGHPAAIVHFPLRLAVLSPNRADAVFRAIGDEADFWVLGGHSLGGAMAARYVKRQAPERVPGLALLAAFPANRDDLSESGLAVASIYGTLDGVAEPRQVLGAAPLLPPDTAFLPIEGGNHAQFGTYGPQRGDNAATISLQEQQDFIVNAVVSLLETATAIP